MIATDRIRYSRITTENATYLIQALRDEIKDEPGLIRDVRFYDNSYVIATLESIFPLSEFLSHPKECVLGALREAAVTDYWYLKEKNYEDTDDSCCVECLDQELEYGN